MGKLSGKVVVVTGAGSGIGRATSLKLSSYGAIVSAADLSLKNAEETVRMVQDAGGEAAAFQVDVTESQSVKAMIDATVQKFGALHGAYNNAGIGGPDGPIVEHSEDGFAKVVAVNLTGVFYCLKHEIAQFLKQGGGGAIVNISSAGGLMAVPTQAAYCATKHAVIGLTKTAAVEYGEAGVRVNAICPGLVGTDGTKSLIPKEVLSMLLANQPIKRMAEPSEVGDVVAYLLSDESSYISGAVLNVDGGLLAQ